MKVELSFSEIQDIVKSKTCKNVSFSQVDSSTMNVAYATSVHLPIIGNVTKTISLKLNVSIMNNTQLIVVYDGGLAVNTIFAGALKLIEHDPKFQFVEAKDNRQLILHLEQLESLKEVFSKVDIQSLEVLENDFNVTCKLKDIF